MNKHMRKMFCLFAILGLLVSFTGTAYAQDANPNSAVSPGMALTCTYNCDGATIQQNTDLTADFLSAGGTPTATNTTNTDAPTATADNSDYGDFSCTGDACGKPLDGDQSYTNGHRLPQQWLASGQTGVSRTPVTWHVRVPSGYFMVFDAFEAHIKGTKVQGKSGVIAAAGGPKEYDIELVDGAVRVLSEDIAKDNVCMTYTNLAGHARDMVVTPKAWGSDPCHVKGTDNSGGGVLTPGGNGAGMNDGAPTPTNNGSTGNGGNATTGNGTDNGNATTGNGSADNSGGSSASATPTDQVCGGAAGDYTGKGQGKEFPAGSCNVGGYQVFDAAHHDVANGDQPLCTNCYWAHSDKALWVVDGGANMQPGELAGMTQKDGN